MITKGFLFKKFNKSRDGVFVKSIMGEQSQLTLLKLEPGKCLSSDGSSEGASEDSSEEIGIILKGGVELKVSNKIFKLQSGDSYVIPKFTPYVFKVLGREPLEYIQVFSPPKK